MMDEIWDSEGNFRGYKPSAQALGRAEWLIQNANISPEFQDWLTDNLMKNTSEQLSDLIRKLEQLQREPADPAKQFNTRIKIQNGN